MDTIEPGTPFPELIAALQDANASMARVLADVKRYGEPSKLVDLDLMQLEDALDAACKHLNIEQLARVGVDGEEVESF